MWIDTLEWLIAIIIAVPVFVWLDYRIHFLKYPRHVKFSNYLKKHHRLWVLYVEYLVIAGFIGVLAYILFKILTHLNY